MIVPIKTAPKVRGRAWGPGTLGETTGLHYELRHGAHFPMFERLEVHEEEEDAAGRHHGDNAVNTCQDDLKNPRTEVSGKIIYEQTVGHGISGRLDKEMIELVIFSVSSPASGTCLLGVRLGSSCFQLFFKSQETEVLHPRCFYSGVGKHRSCHGRTRK